MNEYVFCLFASETPAQVSACRHSLLCFVARRPCGCFGEAGGRAEVARMPRGGRVEADRKPRGGRSEAAQRQRAQKHCGGSAEALLGRLGWCDL